MVARETPGAAPSDDDLVPLDSELPIWDRVFTVAPLVVVGTKEGQEFDLAPKHMATPLGWSNHFGFVCTPSHATYRNAVEEGAFTISYPRPDQVVVSGLTAAPRCDEVEHTPGLDALPTRPASVVDGVVLRDAHLVMECELDRVVDGFGDASLIAGRIVAAGVRRRALRVSEIPDARVLRRAPLLAYLDPGRYAEIDEGDAFPFPAGFRR